MIARVRDAHPRARHHCTAFILGPDGRVARHNDDGEPSGTAGMPMYEALQAAGFSDVVAVVTRYFGGVLLGAAGLTRTYRSAVAQACAAAQPVVREQQQCVTVFCAYDLQGALVSELRRRGVRIGDARYTEQVAQDFWVPVGAENTVCELAAQVSSGAALCEVGQVAFVDVS